jgi:phosphoglycerate kinase
MKLKSFRDAGLAGKRVLTRVDFNVPIQDGRVADDTRIRAALPTIERLVKSEARIILCSHLGRPEGAVCDELRLAPVAPVLEQLLNTYLARNNIEPRRVVVLDDCIGEEVRQAVDAADARDVLLLENLRFHAGETANDPQFAGQLAAVADVYVSDAFGTVHRAHASTEGVAHLLPAYAGYLVAEEVDALNKVAHEPARPFVIILGGAKISGKIDVLAGLLPRADTVLIGGAMANTFLKAQGIGVGASLVEDEMVGTAQQMLALAMQHGTELLLPFDFVVTDSLEPPGGASTVAARSIGSHDIAVDIGESTRERYRDEIRRARTVFWNGPVGVFEVEQFSHGTMSIAHALANAHNTAYTVVGGGESVAAVNKAGVYGRIHHVSTGGGASLEFVAGKELPGLRALQED